MSSWVKLYRQITENELWLSERFTKSQAWIDILILANYKARTVFLKGTEFSMQPGMICWSIKSLASRWKWNERTVEKFLTWLEKREMIQCRKSNITTVITVCNWTKYQKNTARNTEQTQNGIQTDKEGSEEGKETLPGFFECEHFTVTEEERVKYQDTFQLNDRTLKREFLKMADWLKSKKKTMKNYGRFITNWLEKVPAEKLQTSPARKPVAVSAEVRQRLIDAGQI